MTWYILDENNNPVPAEILAAARWFEDNRNNGKRIVARTEVESGVFSHQLAVLSTVFLVLDHSFIPDKVLLYESLWFGGPLDGEMRRYSTREEAQAGHNEMLAYFRQKCSVQIDAWPPNCRSKP